MIAAKHCHADTNRQRHPCTIDHTAEDVAAELIGAETMSPVGS